MMAFPLSRVPYDNISCILEKFAFKEAARLRQTCHQINDFIENSENLFFFAPDNLELHVVGYVDSTGTVTAQFGVYQTSRSTGFHGVGSIEQHLIHHSKGETKSIQCAQFGTIAAVCIYGPGSDSLENLEKLLSSYKEAKLKCNQFQCISHGILADRGLISFTRLFKPRQVCCHAPSKDARPKDDPFRFDVLRELATECKDVLFKMADSIPMDYAPVLCQYESIQIDEVENEMMPSLVPLIQRLLADPDPILRYFQLPIYKQEYFLSQSEIGELDLEKWKLRRGGGLASDRRYPPGLGFVIDSPNHYILLSERLALKWINTVDLKIPSITVSQHFCTWRRISKEDADAFVVDWIDDFLPKIPFDGSDLYEYYKEHGGDYGLLKKYLEGILA